MDLGKTTTVLRDPTAWLPIAISIGSLLLIAGVALFVGVAAHAEEGTPARLFQLGVLAQAVVITLFAIRWLPRAPREAAIVLVLQLAAAAIPILVISVLEASA